MIQPILHIVPTPDKVAEVLSSARIDSVTYAHPPVFTVEDGAAFKHQIAGGHTKNLFLRDKKETMFLVTALDETVIDLKKLSDHLGARRFSFGSPERLLQYLGVTPGSVTPLALMNDTDKKVQPVLDKSIFKQDIVTCHPLRNDMTTAIKSADLIGFLQYLGYQPRLVDFTAL